MCQQDDAVSAKAVENLQGGDDSDIDIIRISFFVLLSVCIDILNQKTIKSPLPRTNNDDYRQRI